jgi:hypothetical protein
MNERIIVGIVCFCVAMTGLFLANLFLTIMIGEVNRKRTDGNLVSYIGFTGPKILRICSEYRRSYPDGKVMIYAVCAFVLAMIGLVGVAVCLRIIG